MTCPSGKLTFETQGAFWSWLRRLPTGKRGGFSRPYNCRLCRRWHATSVSDPRDRRRP